MHLFTRTVATIALLFSGMAAASAQSTEDVCSNSKLPTGVVQLIERKYPGWRLEGVSDLSEEYQRLWTKEHPENCPGFAIGHFRASQT